MTSLAQHCYASKKSTCFGGMVQKMIVTVELEWLPALLCQAPDADWDAYEADLYNVFCTDFISNPPRAKGLEFRLKAHPQVNGRHATFWHLLSSGNGLETLRLVRSERCERIRWPRAMI